MKMTRNKHFNYAYKLGGGVSRRTKKYLRNYCDEMLAEMEEAEPDIHLSELPDCKACEGAGRIEYGYPFAPWDAYDCPDCERTGKYGWEYDKNGVIVRMKEFITPSNNAIRLKRKGVLKKWEGRESIPKEDTPSDNIHS